jgi:hypothetical protein
MKLEFVLKKLTHCGFTSVVTNGSLYQVSNGFGHTVKFTSNSAMVRPGRFTFSTGGAETHGLKLTTCTA